MGAKRNRQSGKSKQPNGSRLTRTISSIIILRKNLIYSQKHTKITIKTLGRQT